jgi:uncharacterized protein
MSDSKSELNRRKFLTASLSCAVAAGFAGISPRVALAQGGDKQKMKGKIIYREMGKTGMKVPVVSMGVGGTNNPEIIKAAYDQGIRHFDTAANYQYGRNEQMVGKFLTRLNDRENINIATKIFTPAQRRGLSAEQKKNKLVSLLEASLKRLKTSYVDVLYIHDVNAPEDISDPAVVETFKMFKKQKKVRAIGVSTHTNMTGVMNEAIKTKDWDVVLTSFNFTLADDKEFMDAIHGASKIGMGIVAMKVMAGGARWPNPESRSAYDSATIAKACLKWVMNDKNITTCIPAFGNYQELNEDFSIASNLAYEPDEKKMLEDNSIKLSMEFCRQCKQCLASCPNNTDIPTLMRTHMYAAQYGDFYLARETLDELPREKSIAACISCDVCTARCANSVNIPRKINELKVMYT